YLMPVEERMRHEAAGGQARRSFLGRVSDRFETGFRRLTRAYQSALDWSLEHRSVSLTAFLTFAVASLFLFPFVGRDFFPPIDVQISGPIQESDANYKAAQQLARDLSLVPGAVDVHVQQIVDSPRIMIDTDRLMAQQVGLTEANMASSLSVFLAGSGVATTNF